MRVVNYNQYFFLKKAITVSSKLGQLITGLLRMLTDAGFTECLCQARWDDFLSDRGLIVPDRWSPGTVTDQVFFFLVAMKVQRANLQPSLCSVWVQQAFFSSPL